jgi:hypothetical protein
MRGIICWCGLLMVVGCSQNLLRPGPGRDASTTLNLSASVDGSISLGDVQRKVGPKHGAAVFENVPLGRDIVLVFRCEKRDTPERIVLRLPRGWTRSVGCHYVSPSGPPITASGAGARGVDTSMPIERARQAALVAALLDALRNTGETALSKHLPAEGFRVSRDEAGVEAIAQEGAFELAGIRVSTITVIRDYVLQTDAICADVPAGNILSHLLQRGVGVACKFEDEGAIAEVTLTFWGVALTGQ